MENSGETKSEVVVEGDVVKKLERSNSIEMKTLGDNQVVATVKVDTEPEKVEEDGTMNSVQFAVNIMKGIAGTGCLAIPSAVLNVGIISGIILFVVVGAAYILAANQLASIKTSMDKKEISVTGINTDNDYARICYYTLAKPGYYIFNIALLITLYGSCVGTIIVMTDFLDSLPILKSLSPQVKRNILQSILTVVCIVLCLLKDPSLLVLISSFGLIALVISLIILFVYGVSKYGMTFKTDYLYPISFQNFLTNLGIFVFSLGFLLFFLSQLKYVKRAYKKTIPKTIFIAVSIMAFIYILIGIIFLLIFNNSPGGVPGNILRSLPSESVANVIISLLMVLTCIGSFPLYIGPIHEVLNFNPKTLKSNRFFIVSWKFVLVTIVENVIISLIGAFIPEFNKILNFNILYSLV